MPLTDHWKERIRPYYLPWVYFPLFPSRKPAAFCDCRPACDPLDVTPANLHALSRTRTPHAAVKARARRSYLSPSAGGPTGTWRRHSCLLAGTLARVWHCGTLLRSFARSATIP